MATSFKNMSRHVRFEEVQHISYGFSTETRPVRTTKELNRNFFQTLVEHTEKEATKMKIYEENESEIPRRTEKPMIAGLLTMSKSTAFK